MLILPASASARSHIIQLKGLQLCELKGRGHATKYLATRYVKKPDDVQVRIG